jgi:putative GTP pyrophosphokinase
MLEIADREFQQIDDEHRKVTQEARAAVERGDFAAVEITPDAIKAYLDRRFGVDDRIREWSYKWTVSLLRQLDIRDIDQLDEILLGYDDDKISRLLHGKRTGQIRRFEATLMAAMGRSYAAKHPFNTPDDDWFTNMCDRQLKLLKSGLILPNPSYDS